MSRMRKVVLWVVRGLCLAGFYALAVFILLLFLLADFAHAQTFALAPVARQQFFTNTGAVAAGYKLCTFAAGTTTPLAAYSDNIGTALPNPISLNSAGRPQTGGGTETGLYLGTSAYKLILYASGTGNNCNGTIVGALIWSQDQVATFPASFGGTFTGTLATTAGLFHTIGGTLSSNIQLSVAGAFTPGVASAYGIAVQTNFAMSPNQSGVGIYANPTFTKSSSGTHAALTALAVQPAFVAGTASVTDAIGIDIGTFTAPASTTNATGLRVSAPTGAANNYAINVTSGISQFSGNVGILASPLSPLHVHTGTNANLRVDNAGGNLSLETHMDASSTINGMVINGFPVNIQANSTSAAYVDTNGGNGRVIVNYGLLGNGTDFSSGILVSKGTFAVVTAGSNATVLAINASGGDGNAQIVTTKTGAGTTKPFEIFSDSTLITTHTVVSGTPQLIVGAGSTDFSPGNIPFIVISADPVIASASATTNANVLTMRAGISGGNPQIVSTHSGGGTTKPLDTFVESSNVIRVGDATNGVCVRVGSALRLLTSNGTNFLDGGACPF